MVTAVILTKNEEANLRDCLVSLKWCNEILVVDDNSSDQTVAIAKKHGAVIYTRSLENDFASQRNFALQKAKNEWVFFVDADERVSKELIEEIESILYAFPHSYNGFFIPRLDTIWDKTLRFGETGSKKLLRLGKKEHGKWIGSVHETWDIQGSIGQLKHPIMHYPHQSVAEFLQEVNYYTDIRAGQLSESQIRTNFFLILFYPLSKFVINYIYKLGFLDGVPGITVALMMSFHSFLVRSKLWVLQHEKL